MPSVRAGDAKVRKKKKFTKKGLGDLLNFPFERYVLYKIHVRFNRHTTKIYIHNIQSTKRETSKNDCFS